MCVPIVNHQKNEGAQLCLSWVGGLGGSWRATKPGVKAHPGCPVEMPQWYSRWHFLSQTGQSGRQARLKEQHIALTVYLKSLPFISWIKCRKKVKR